MENKKDLYRILVINPGATTTKIAIFENNKNIHQYTITHAPEIINACSSAVYDQYEFRLEAIKEFLKEHKIDLHEYSAIVGRGGFIKSYKSGTYRVNEKMIEDLKNPWSEHVANLGGIIAKELGNTVEIPAYIVDPVCIDELEDIARVSGFDGFERVAKWQPLSHKATARKLAEDLGKKYEDCNFIIGHLGGGITVGAHNHGRVVDVNNGLDGDGPFSLDRPGTLPIRDVIAMCFEGHTKEEVVKTFISKGGLYSYFKTTDVREVESMAKTGNKKAELILSAMAYQIAKEIGAQATVLKGKVDAIALTGGISNSKYITSKIIESVKFIAPVYLYPGEREMEALALGALRDLTGEAEAIAYEDESYI